MNTINKMHRQWWGRDTVIGRVINTSKTTIQHGEHTVTVKPLKVTNELVRWVQTCINRMSGLTTESPKSNSPTLIRCVAMLNETPPFKDRRSKIQRCIHYFIFTLILFQSDIEQNARSWKFHFVYLIYLHIIYISHYCGNTYSSHLLNVKMLFYN